MKKFILATVAIFCFGLIYGQPQAVKHFIGIEQEQAFNDLVFPKGTFAFDEKELTLNGRLCKVFVKKRDSRNTNRYIKTIEDVMKLLKDQEVRLDYLPRGMPLEFYFTDQKIYTPSFDPKFSNIEKYDGFTEHKVLVLTHMADWSPVCKIIISKEGKNKAFLKNRLIYAMGRVILEHKQHPYYYWDPNSVLNDLNQKGVDGNWQDHKKFGGELNRFATHSAKAFVGELFAYAVLGELREVLPRDRLTADRALTFYLRDCMGPMCKSLRPGK